MKLFPNVSRRAFAKNGFGLGLMAWVFHPHALRASEVGTLIGTIVDIQHQQAGIPGARVSIGHLLEITGPADNGGFVLRNVPSGQQKLHVTAIGWKSVTVTITVLPNATTNVGAIGLASTVEN
jgi:CarboxypepD_reg-like domain